jgi:hypothetical protein
MSITERQLAELTQRLGEEAGERLDVEETAAAVIERLREEPNFAGGWRQHTPVLGAIAAAAALVLAVSILSDGDGNPLLNGSDLAAAPATLQALSVEELEEVYDSLSFEAPISELATAGLDDMNIGQLEELLETLMED